MALLSRSRGSDDVVVITSFPPLVGLQVGVIHPLFYVYYLIRSRCVSSLRDCVRCFVRPEALLRPTVSGPHFWDSPFRYLSTLSVPVPLSFN